MRRREGVWREEPDLRALEGLVEELRSRGPAPPHRKGTRWGSRASGAAYYAEIELWKVRPDFVAFRRLVDELKARQVAGSFVDRLRDKFAIAAQLPVADRRQLVGVSDELIELALAGGRLPAPVVERLKTFLASPDSGVAGGLRV